MQLPREPAPPSDGRLVSVDDGPNAGYVRTPNCLGRGSFGSVFEYYKCAQPHIWVRVAVKEVDLKASKNDEEKCLRIHELRFECTFARRASGPNVVEVYRPWLDRDRGVLCLPQELCDESLETFRQRFQGRQVPAEKLCSLLYQCLNALVALQASDIVHNDLKPENILLIWPKGSDVDVPVVKLADFGLSSTGNEMRTSNRHACVGTPYFMAPEAFDKGTAAVPHARDVWALACTFYLLLTGSLPFFGSEFEEIEMRAREGIPTAWSGFKHATRAGQQLCILLCRTFNPNPANRLTALQLRNALAMAPGLCSLLPARLPVKVAPSYGCYVVCRPNVKLILYSQPVARAEFATGDVLSAAAGSIIADTKCVTAHPRAASRSKDSAPHTHVGRLPSVGGRGDRWDDSADAHSPRARTVPAIATVLCRQSSPCPPPPPPKTAWARVFFPYRGFCQWVEEGHHLLHRCEDVPDGGCPALLHTRAAPLFQPPEGSIWGPPQPQPLSQVFECVGNVHVASAPPQRGGIADDCGCNADSPPARRPAEQPRGTHHARGPSFKARVRSLFTGKSSASPAKSNS